MSKRIPGEVQGLGIQLVRLRPAADDGIADTVCGHDLYGGAAVISAGEELAYTDIFDPADYEHSAGEHTMAYYLDAAASKYCIGIHHYTVRDISPGTRSTIAAAYSRPMIRRTRSWLTTLGEQTRMFTNWFISAASESLSRRALFRRPRRSLSI